MNAIPKTSVSARLLSSTLRQYKRNEDSNRHAENAWLIAQIVGTTHQKEVCRIFWEVSLLLNELPKDDKLRLWHDTATNDCWQKFKAQCEAAGVQIP